MATATRRATVALTLVVAGAGLLDRTLYRPGMPESLLPRLASQKIVSLLVALLVLICLQACRRGAQRPWLVVIGLHGYLLYAYALYAFAGVYKSLFLCYMAILGLSLHTIGAIFLFADILYCTR